MGNAKSKDGEHQLEKVVATGQTSGTNHEEYSATLIPFDEQDEANYATEPAPTSETNPIESNSSIVNVSGNVDPRYTTETDGSEWVRVGYHANGQTAPANLTELRVDTEDNTVSEQLETGAVIHESKKYAEEAREQYNAQKRAAYGKKKNEEVVSLQEENQPVLAKSGGLSSNKTNGLDNQQVNGQSARRRSLCDITNVMEDTEINKATPDYHASSKNASGEKKNATYPHEAMVTSGVLCLRDKKEQRNALERANCRRKKQPNDRDENAHALYSADDNIILNDTQETDHKTEEERKRDHRNTLRRVSYRRKKQPNILDENQCIPILSDNPTRSTTFPSSSTVSSGLIYDNELPDVNVILNDYPETEQKNGRRTQERP